MSSPSIDPRTVIGHVHLKVSDIKRSEEFYRDILGFEVTARYGTDAVFMSAGGYHHHIGLNTWHSKGAAPASPNHPGLYHFAILYPDRPALGRAVSTVLSRGWPIDGVADHGVSEAVYLSDPDGNGIELYRDRNPSEWKRNPDGSVAMVTERLDVASLVDEATSNETSERDPGDVYMPVGRVSTSGFDSPGRQ